MTSNDAVNEKFIEVNGIRLCCQEAGEGTEKNAPMMFVRGLGFSKENMNPLSTITSSFTM